MDRCNKENLVSCYVKLFQDHKAIFLINNLGLSVADSRYMKKELHSVGVKFLMIKNSLLRVAVGKLNFLNISDLFVGPIVLAYSNEPISSSKLLVRLLHQGSKIKIVGGFVSGHRLEEQDVLALSKMPAQNEIRGQIIHLLNSTSVKLLSLMNLPASKLVRLIESYSKK